MAELCVRKVEVYGRKLSGVLRPLVRTAGDSNSLRGKGLSGIVYHTNQGTFFGRLDDLSKLPLGASLNPNGHRQAFVQEGVLRAAENLLANEIIPKLTDPSSRFHHYLGAEALEKPQFDIPDDKPVDFANLAFGLNRSEVMFLAQIPRGGDWTAVSAGDSLFAFEDFPISPAAQVLHYAQGGFEGGKAYRYSDGRIVTFRLRDNAERFIKSAQRVALTPVPVDVFLAAVKATVLANRDLVAPPGVGAAMYIRPYHFGSGPQLGVAPAPSETFGVFVSPVGPYFKGGFSGKRMKVETEYRRSAPGLMGDTKVSANYAGSLVPGLRAKSSGHIRMADLGADSHRKWQALLENGYIDKDGIMKAFNDKRESLDLKGSVSKEEEDAIYKTMKDSHFAEVIYLDAIHGNFLEEVGAANAFFVKDGILYTPKLGSILPGITRDSVITLAKEKGLIVVDYEQLPVEMLMEADEVFCTGTAAVITPISSVTLKGKTRIYNNGAVGTITRDLYDTLVGIQEGRIADTHGWIYPLEDTIPSAPVFVSAG